MSEEFTYRYNVQESGTYPDGNGIEIPAGDFDLEIKGNFVGKLTMQTYPVPATNNADWFDYYETYTTPSDYTIEMATSRKVRFKVELQSGEMIIRLSWKNAD